MGEAKMQFSFTHEIVFEEKGFFTSAIFLS
jgi:hypothetical protein